jgi:hypothetical protein
MLPVTRLAWRPAGPGRYAARPCRLCGRYADSNLAGGHDQSCILMDERIVEWA